MEITFLCEIIHLAAGACHTSFLPHMPRWFAAAFRMPMVVGWETRPWPTLGRGRSARSGSDPCPLLGDVCMGMFSLWVIKCMQWPETRSVGASSALALWLLPIGIFRLVLRSNTALILWKEIYMEISDFSHGLCDLSGYFILN